MAFEELRPKYRVCKKQQHNINNVLLIIINFITIQHNNNDYVTSQF